MTYPRPELLVHAEDSDPCLFLHNFKGQSFFLWYTVVKRSRQNVINKEENELV